MDITKKDIEDYLSEVKESVKKNNYRLELNKRRQNNRKLFLDYIIDDEKVEEIIFALSVMDFSTILKNKHKGFEDERLYVFGKKAMLIPKYEVDEKEVDLYIKFNKIQDGYIIIISFHEQKYPLIYFFKGEEQW